MGFRDPVPEVEIIRLYFSFLTRLSRILSAEKRLYHIEFTNSVMIALTQIGERVYNVSMDQGCIYHFVRCGLRRTSYWTLSLVTTTPIGWFPCIFVIQHRNLNPLEPMHITQAKTFRALIRVTDSRAAPSSATLPTKTLLLDISFWNWQCNPFK